jgi:flagellar biosynthesis regulator FlaF
VSELDIGSVGILRRFCMNASRAAAGAVRRAIPAARWRHRRDVAVLRQLREKDRALPYYLRAPLPHRPAYVDYEDTAFTFDHPAL